jgi:hypothetical protein
MERTAEERIGAGYGAAFGVLLLWVAMTAMIDSRWCGDIVCRGGLHLWQPEPITLEWRPFVDNPAAGAASGEVETAVCPRRRPEAPGAILEDAPLPRWFGRSSAPGLFACVRVGADGKVVRAYLVGSSGLSADEAGALLSSIRHWQFDPSDDGAGWQRVRLSAPLPEAPELESIPMLL